MLLIPEGGRFKQFAPPYSNPIVCSIKPIPGRLFLLEHDFPDSQKQPVLRGSDGLSFPLLRASELAALR